MLTTFLVICSSVTTTLLAALLLSGTVAAKAQIQTIDEINVH